MSQFLTYQDFAVEGKVRQLQQQLISIDSEQAYGMTQAQTYDTNSVTIESNGFPSSFDPNYLAYSLAAWIEFRGIYPDKNAIGGLYSKTPADEPRIRSDRIKYRSTDEPNVLQFWVWLFNGTRQNGQPRILPGQPFSIDVYCRANMPGAIKILRTRTMEEAIFPNV